MTEHSDTYWNKLLEQYQSGTINEEDQYKLEKRALDDPFLFDALEGFAMVNDQAKDQIKEETKVKNKILTIPRMATAASLVFLIAMVFLLKNDTPKNLPNQEPITMVLDKGDERQTTILDTGTSNDDIPNKTETESKSTTKNNKRNNNPSSASTNLESTTSPQKPKSSTKKSDAIAKTEYTHDKIITEHNLDDIIESSPVPEKIETEAEVATIDHDRNTSLESTTHSKIPVSDQQNGEMADLNDNPPLKKTKKTKEEAKVFYKVTPAIGIKDFEEYVKESIEMRGLQQNPTLDVTIEFDINSNGEITNFLHIFNGCPECGAYAIHLLSGSGVWHTSPKGQEGRARYVLKF